MAESGRIFPRQLLDLDQIMRDARCRWLRPGEICEILCNYKMFQLMSNPPARPPAGSLFLFDRKVLRYFRKDGHRWRKKKDGKTIKEAHEKLKSGSVEVLHCYYAHGEDNENFQRRCYWMLDGKLEHIVLVHYRDLKEVEAPISRSAPGLTHSGSISSYPTAQMFPMSVSCNVDQDGLTMSQEIHNLESGEDFTSSQSEAVHGPICLSTSSPRQEGMDLSSNSSSFLRNKMHGWGRNKHETQNKHVESVAQDVTTISDGIFFNTNAQVSHSSLESEDQVEGTKSEPAVSDSCVGALNKLDSFGRWMDKEIGKDCEGSFMVSGSENYWNSVTTESDDKEVSSLSPQIQLDLDSLGPSLSQEQLFSITDFSPDWAFSGVDTKVIIAGKFLGDKKPIEWACMFGEFEVPAEVLTDNAIRCHAPPHAPGRVPFYVTGSNRQACSEIREFEYLKNPILENTKAVSGEDEVRLQVRLAKLLSLSVGSNLSNCSLKDCSKCKLIDSIYSRRNCGENHLKSFMVDLPLSMGHQTSAKDLLIENLLKDKFFEWLFYAAHDDGKGPLVLDDKGQGVVHLAAALGYHWAIGPVIAAGVSPDFRDAHGRTGLHWAAYYGREETVIVLSRLHTSPSAVDDPSQACPGAQKAADLAANRGHKGIAAYLAEADLNSQLSALTLKVNATNDVTADGNGGKAIEMENTVVFADRIVDESVSIKGPLAVLTKAAHAAAFIQAAFRTRSFKQRHLNSNNDSISEDSVNLVALGYMNRVQGMSNFNDYLHSAAFKIQHKYRGWRSRKNFLKIHNRLVQIQAHARGHQLRQRYKKVVWSVSMMEKAILRWRRRRPGLRGFRTDILAEDATTKDNADEYEFLHIGQKQKYSGVETALARVQSMVHYPEAREQYMRLASSYISQATVE